MSEKKPAWDYSTAEKYLSELAIFGIKLGLEQTRELFRQAGNPHEKLKFIHIAGTNGKGSAGAMLASMLKEAGIKTGFYSSPHLVSVRERFRINGRAISEENFSDIISTLKTHIEAMRKNGACPTYFETTTALAAIFFAQEKSDLVIWETGMGGRFDATNIIDPECSVITGVSLEHQEHLGDSIEKIAFEKAGIIKKNKPVFCGKMPHEALEVIKRKCTETDSQLFTPDIIKEAYLEKLPLPGNAEKDNAKLALAVVGFLAGKKAFDLATALKGLEKTRWPGRFQILPDGNITDGAHNPEGANCLVEFLESEFPGEKFEIIFGGATGKKTDKVLETILPKAEKFIFVPLKGARQGLSPDELQNILHGLSPAAPSEKADSFAEAIKKTSGKKRILITGSLYLAGEALSHYFSEEEICNI